MGHFIEVSDGAVYQGAQATKSLLHVAVYFGPEGADHAGVVEILNADDLWSGYCSHVATILVPCLGIRRSMCLAAGTVRERISDGGALMLCHAPTFFTEGPPLPELSRSPVLR
jgi:hypothetical protein